MPTENVTATTEGYPTARYTVPPETPRGTAYVTSFGIVSADVARTGHPTPLLQVRLSVSNDSGTAPWSIDTRDQLLEVPGAGRLRAAMMNSDQQTGAILTVPPGQKRTLDLYYMLPPNIASAETLPRSFDLLWRVQTPERVVAQRTPFTKERVEPAASPAYADVALGVGWGPYWWYNPLYPTLAFYPPPLVLHSPYYHGYPGFRGYPGPVHVGPHPGSMSAWRGHPVHR
jgi:hypothetical protein